MSSLDFTNASDGNGQSMDEGSVQPFIQTPLIPQAVYDNLPEFIKELTTLYQPGSRKQDIFLTGLLPAIGSCLFDIKGIYQDKCYYPSLYTFIIGYPGSDKGAMGDAIELLQPLNNFLAEQQERIRLIIPANISSSQLMARLAANKGVGFIPSQEADTFSNAQRQKWGAALSDMIRNIFEHETLRQDRKLDGEVIVTNPKACLAFSGTPDQLGGIVSNISNGTSSRFLFYYLEQNGRWRRESENRGIDISSTIRSKGERLIPFYHFNKAHPCTFEFSANQKLQFDDYFEPLMVSFGAMHGPQQDATIKRLGVCVFKIAMALTAVRKWQDGNVENSVVCNDLDFQSAMMLVQTYKAHVEAIINLFPPKEDLTTVGRFKKVLDELPMEFSKQEALAKAIVHGLSQRTLARRIERMRVSHGQYRKC